MIDGKVNYYHSVITPVIVQPGKEQVICLEPEFIRKQDGHNKQDCEIAAGKRWIEAHGEYYAKENVTLLGDDLYCHQPFCKLLRSKGFYFIFVCKSESHEMLYETVRFLAANGTLSSHCVRRCNGKHGEIHTYRYTNDLPLIGEPDAMLVNWCELSITHEQTGEVIYRNAFATDFMILETTVEAIVQDGRARWKVENENNNVLKTKGYYHLEHNFGHGDNFLASFLLSLNLLAFLFQTVLPLMDPRYQLIRKELRKRQKFLTINALLHYLVFDDWDHLLNFMIAGLEIEIPSSA